MRLRILYLLLLIGFIFHPAPIKAQELIPAEPAKSVYLTDFFNLYRFLPPQEILLYENHDLPRKDIKQRIISAEGAKQGDECVIGDPNACKRPVVVIENEESPGHIVRQTILNADGVCRPQVTAGSEEGSPGYCDFRKKPTNIVDVTAVDYSKSQGLTFCKLQNRFCSYWNNGGENEIAWGSHNLSVSASDQYVRRAITLAQAGQTKETVESTDEFPLGGVRWDAPLDRPLLNPLQSTVSSTGPKCETIVGTFVSVGETVIGAVNGNGEDSVWRCGEDGKWQAAPAGTTITFRPASYAGAPAVCRSGDNIYKHGDIVDGKEQCSSAGKLVPLTQASSDKTLLDAWQDLGADAEGAAIKSSARLLLSYWQSMVKPPPPGEEETVPGASSAIRSITDIVSRNLAKPVSERPEWLESFLRAPECGPGYDKGYALVSVCMLGACTPVSSKEQFVSNPSFRNQTLYSDPRIRQNLCAAVYDLYQQYPLDEARSIIRKAKHMNPLLDCTLRADEACTASALDERLSGSLDTGTYTQAKNKFFNLAWFHKIIDGWRMPDGGFWYAKIDFKIKPGGEYRGAGAVEDVGTLGVILNEVSAIAQDWIDSVFQALHHTVMVPPLAAHSIDAIEKATALIQQTAKQNEKDDEAARDYSNAVAGSTDLRVGNAMAPRRSQGSLAWWPCDNPLFSASLLIKIVEYVSGNRIGCHGDDSTSTTAGAASCSADVNEDQISEVADKIGAKYGIQGSWLAAMWKLEGGSTQMGEACQEKNIYKVMGPLQITAGAYRSATCANERFSTPEQEKTQCGNTEKLSRCSLEGSMEIAARTILSKLKAYGYYQGEIDCRATQAAVSGSQLFRAVNAYGACGRIGDTSYAEWVCDVAGSCPSPLPTSGTPISCLGN